MVDNSLCERCGNCCSGLVWRKKRSYKDFSINSKDKAEQEIKEKYVEYLNKVGLPIVRLYPLEWDDKEKEVTIRAQTGICRHLSFEGDKAVCLNYKNRPNECRNFLCKRIQDHLDKKMV